MAVLSATKKHRITLTEEELEALRDRLVPVSPLDYDLHTYAILRDLYGRFDHILLMSK
ncbi:hypothetical protein ES708_11543 [subsurface metagenome]